MIGFVLDASITLSWCFDDEALPMSIKLLERSAEESVFVPQIWPLEVGNALVISEKKKRISYAKMLEFISILGNLNIHIDDKTSQHGFHEILSLAHSENLTTYDATYLELAMRLGLPLATLDKQLKKAALNVGVNIITT
jgi:predicted nucleic acid-binding protein